MAGVIGAIDFTHLGHQLLVQQSRRLVVVAQRPDHHADRFTVPTGNILPAAFKAVEAALRQRAASAHLAQRRRRRIFHITIGIGHPAAGEHGLNVMFRDAIARDPDVEASRAYLRHRQRGDAQVQIKGLARQRLRLQQRAARGLQQLRRHAQHRAIALEYERDVDVARGIQHRGNDGRAHGVDVLVVARLDRRRGISHIAHHHMPVIRQRRATVRAGHVGKLGQQRQFCVKQGIAHRFRPVEIHNKMGRRQTLRILR